MSKRLILLLTLSFLFTNTVYAEKEERYMPYPIVFVSGIKTSTNPELEGYPAKVWPNSRIFKEFKKYFHDGDSNNAPPKYDDKGSDNAGEVSHLEFFFFDARQAPLATNANILRETIKNVLERYYDTNKYTYTEPCSTPKVVLVCHSLGGLIARYMLVKHTEMQDKVAAVFFLGVPQQGSPLAVIGYFLPKEILALTQDIVTIEDIIDSEDMEQWKKEQYLNMIREEEEKIEGDLRFMRYAESNEKEVRGLSYTVFKPLYTSTRDQSDNDQLKAVLGENFENTWGLPKVTEKGVIKAALIPNALANTYRHTFKAYSNSGTFDILAGREALVRSVPENGPLTYDSTDPNVCELAGLGTSLGKVQKVHAIVGTQDDVIREYLISAANCYMGTENFNRHDYSFYENGLWNDGDGVVNLASQSVIGQQVHIIDAAHVGNLGPILTGETDHPATPTIILQAIEDKPEIEKVYAIPEDWNKTYAQPTDDSYSWYYLIFKLKDYLLADIEIESLTLDGADISGGMVKPYNTIGKAFLKERDCNGVDSPNELAKYKDIYNNEKYLPLMPGEFYIKTKIPSDAQILYIKVKNPAAQYDSTNFTAEKTLTIARPKVTTVDFTPHNRRLTTSYYSPYNIHAIDVPPYDESYTYLKDGNVLPCPDSLPNEVKLSFKIEESPTQQVEVNAWIYSYPPGNLDMVWKRFSTARPVTLESAGSLYNKYFDPNIEPFAIWNGDRDGSGYVPPWPDELPWGYTPRDYEVKITTEPDDNPLDDKLYLLGSNWDDPDHNKKWLYISGQWQENVNNDIIVADPTFIQTSRREGISW